MADQTQNSRSLRWKRLLVISAGSAAGITLAIAGLTVAALCYTNRPVKALPWDQTAIGATYAGLSISGRVDQPLICTFQYAVENHTGRDYELPSSANVYRVLAEGKGLERDVTLKWAGTTALPAGQKMNVEIEIEYEYTENFSYADRSNWKKLTAFINHRLSEIDGFTALDAVTRHEIRFPKPPTELKP